MYEFASWWNQEYLGKKLNLISSIFFFRLNKRPATLIFLLLKYKFN